MPSVQFKAGKFEGLDLGCFDMKRTLGCGSFGRVKLVTISTKAQVEIGENAKNMSPQYALKFMKKHEIIKLKQVDHINAERQLMNQVNHPAVVNMVGSFKDDRFVFILMECISGGELFTHLRRARKFTDAQAKFYGAQVASAFDHLHQKNIIHRDLKPENLLLCANGYAKLTDFGFAKIVEPGSRTYTLCGTPEYIAPEVLLNKGHGKPVDWWTLGILIFEMIVGQPPFCDEEPMGIYQKILAGKVYFPKYFDKNAKSLVKKLLTADLSKRFGNLKSGADDIIKHKWFASIEWDKLAKYELVAPYKPQMKDEMDVSNFEEIPDSVELPPVVSAAADPFVDWL